MDQHIRKFINKYEPNTNIDDWVVERDCENILVRKGRGFYYAYNYNMVYKEEIEFGRNNIRSQIENAIKSFIEDDPENKIMAKIYLYRYGPTTVVYMNKLDKVHDLILGGYTWCKIEYYRVLTGDKYDEFLEENMEYFTLGEDTSSEILSMLRFSAYGDTMLPLSFLDKNKPLIAHETFSGKDGLMISIDRPNFTNYENTGICTHQNMRNLTDGSFSVN